MAGVGVRVIISIRTMEDLMSSSGPYEVLRLEPPNESREAPELTSPLIAINVRWLFIHRWITDASLL